MAQIETLEQFRSTIQPGDQFWRIQMDLSTGLPACIEHFTLLGYEAEEGQWIIVKRPESRYPQGMSINDSLNIWHGTFTTKAEAEAEFERRRHHPIPPDPHMASGWSQDFV